MSAPLLDAIIIGTGFSGIGMAIELKKSGIQNFKLLEKASSVAGTWRENTYPGAACDVQSHLYSFSFAPNTQWSKVYSGWREIRDYLVRVFEEHELAGHTQFNATMVAADYLDDEQCWQVTLSDGRTHKGRNLILGTGPLHVPSIPNLPGLADFKGEVMHSAQWRHDVAIQNKQVVSIGTGGSAIQYVPEIAKIAKRLTVFQRTAAWVMPRNERRYWGLEKWLFRHVPGWRAAYRSLLYWLNESRVLFMLKPKAAAIGGFVAKMHLYRQVKNPILRKKLLPDYTIGCKRVLISNQYFPTFNRENVDLITHGFDRFVEDGIIDSKGRHIPADVVVLGTGFVADPAQYLKALPIRAHGKTLVESWQDTGAESYLGISVAGFPNLFQMVGPNTGLGHNSMVYMIESQCRYIADALKQQAQKQSSLDLKPEVQSRYNADIQQRLAKTVWQSGCSSWYKRDDGKNFTLWPGTTFSYRARTKRIDPACYEWQPYPLAAEAQTPDSVKQAVNQ